MSSSEYLKESRERQGPLKLLFVFFPPYMLSTVLLPAIICLLFHRGETEPHHSLFITHSAATRPTVMAYSVKHLNSNIIISLYHFNTFR